MRRSLKALLRQYARNRSGLGAIEFALIVPVLAMLLLGGFDLGRYVLATERVEEVANSVAQMLGQTAPGGTVVEPGDGSVSSTDLHFFWDSAIFTFPDVLSQAQANNQNWWDLLQVQMSSLKFVAPPLGCSVACPYTAKVVWTNGTMGLACSSTLNPVSDANAGTVGTLPTDLYGPGSVIEVDVAYTFVPTFGANYLPSMPIRRTVYLAPRNVPIVESSASDVPNCPNSL